MVCFVSRSSVVHTLLGAVNLMEVAMVCHVI